jgi:TP901 family phage tail tape measure protein
MVAGLALVAGFAVAIKAAADFEKKMDYFGAVNNATAADMEKVRAKALELGRDSQFSAGQIADAFVEMGKAGISVTDITGGLADAIVNMAAAADISLDQATNIVTSQIQAYGLAVKDAAHITNIMAGAANASIIDVEDLGVSLKYVGGVAHALGISFDSTVTALSLLGKAGIKGSTAGTSLRQIMVSLAGGTSKAKDELKALGIITKSGSNLFFDATGKAKSLDQVFQILQDHTRGLTQEQQLMAYRTIFNNRALAAAEILTKSGAAGFAQMATQMSKTTAADVAAKRMDNLSGDIKHLKSSIDTLMIQAGTPFQNMLRGIVQSLTKLINAFIDMPSGAQTTILAFIAITGVTLTMIGAIALIGGTLFKAAAVMRQTVGAYRALVAITRILTAATWEMTIAALSNPYVIIGVAIVALIVGMYLLYQRSEKFRAILSAIGSGIKTGFLATVNWFKSLPGFFERLWHDIAGWFMTGVNWVVKLWDSLGSKIKSSLDYISGMWTYFGLKIINFFEGIPYALGMLVDQAMMIIVTFFKNLPYEVGYGLGYILGLLVRGFLNMNKAIYNFAMTATKDVGDFFVALPGHIENVLVAMTVAFVKWAKSFGISVKNWAVNAYNVTITWFSKLPGRVASFFTSLWHNSVKAFDSFTVALTRWLINTYNATVTWFAKLPGRVYSALVDLKNRAVSAFNATVSAAKNFGKEVYDGAMNFINKIPGAVWGALNNAIGTFKSMISSAYNSAKDFGQGLWDGFKHGMGINSPSYIEKAMVQVTKVTDAETKKLGNQVKVLRGLAGQITDTNPAKASAALNTSTMAGLTQNLAQQALMLHAASSALYPMGDANSIARASASSGPSSTSSTSWDKGGDQRAINVTVNNPVAERASDSTARKLRTLTSMGAF